MLSLSGVTMRFGSKILYENVDLQLNPGRRYGLVGANGCGKSTLLEILSGNLVPDKGDIATPSGVTIGTMKQDQYLFDEEPLLNVVLRGKEQLWEAMQQRQHLFDTVEEFDEATCHRLEKLESIIAAHDGYVAESDAAKLLEGLGIPAEKHFQPMRLFSGGYKLRVLLARLLFSDCDFLLLDEPTNHLDLFTIRWLEEFLRNYRGTLLVISHDRMFLNNVCTDILDTDHNTVRHFKGNYDAFVQAKSEMHLLMEKQMVNQEKRRDQLMEFVEKLGAKASKATQAKSKMHLVEKLNDQMAELEVAPSSRRSPRLGFKVDKASGARVLRVDTLSKNYGENHVLNNVTLEIERGEKVAFLGANGIGKTTFLEIITGNIELTSGSFEWGHNANVAYFPQDPRKALDQDKTPLEWLCSIDYKVSEQQVRGLLGRVLIEGDEVHQPINTLSGGEMARLILAQMMIKKPNVLIFDEPTNHLDMESMEELLNCLNDYDGTVLLVSHNRYFVSTFADRIIEIQPEGIANYLCTYEEYIAKRDLDLLDRNVKRPTAKQQTTKASDPLPREDKRKKAHLEKDLKEVEDKCSSLEIELKEIDSKLFDPEYYVKASFDEQNKLKGRKEAIEKELESLIVRWEEINQVLAKST
ncbi:MAG: ABC-F family ATP-binding cassette domain-containing protein [Parachlamydiales bacterium]